MSCNPAIGGRWQRANRSRDRCLGWQMGKVTDATGIQFRAQSHKGPGHALAARPRPIRKQYQFEMKRRVESQPNLTLRQEMVEALILAQSGKRVSWDRCAGDTEYRARGCVDTGTFLKALTACG